MTSFSSIEHIEGITFLVNKLHILNVVGKVEVVAGELGKVKEEVDVEEVDKEVKPAERHNQKK